MTQHHSRSPFAARLRLEVCEERIVPALVALLDVSATVDLVGPLAAAVHLDARLTADSAEVGHVRADVVLDHPAESSAAVEYASTSGETAAPAAKAAGGARESAPAYLEDSTTWMLDPGALAMEVSIAAARTRVPPPKSGGSHGAGGDKGGDPADIGPVDLKHPGETVVASADTHDHPSRLDDRSSGRGDANPSQFPPEGLATDRTPPPTAVGAAAWSIDHASSPPESAPVADDEEAPPLAAPAVPNSGPVAAAVQVAAAMQGVAPAAGTAADLLARFAPFDPKAAEESVDRFLDRLRSQRESGDWLTRRHVALVGVALAAGVSAGEVARRKQVPQRLSRLLSLTRTRPGTRTV